MTPGEEGLGVAVVFLWGASEEWLDMGDAALFSSVAQVCNLKRKKL